MKSQVTAQGQALLQKLFYGELRNLKGHQNGAPSWILAEGA